MLLKSTDDLEKNFTDYYDKYLIAEVIILQKYRKKLLFIFLFIIIISIISIIIINKLLYINYIFLFILMFLICQFAYYILINKYKKKLINIDFINKFINYLNGFIFNKINDETSIKNKHYSNLQNNTGGFLLNTIYNIFFKKNNIKNNYIPSEYEISNSRILNSKLIVDGYDDIITDEEIYGKYLNVNVSIAEKKLIKIHYDSKYNQIETIFNGMMILIGVNKKFKSETIVKNKAVYNLYENNIYSQIFKKINLEDPEFNKLFDVFSLDQIEARYILTPAFMERLKKLKDIFYTNKIRCSFRNNKIFISIETRKNMFELGNLIIGTNFKIVFKCLQNILDILKIVEVLKLN